MRRNNPYSSSGSARGTGGIPGVSYDYDIEDLYEEPLPASDAAPGTESTGKSPDKDRAPHSAGQPGRRRTGRRRHEGSGEEHGRSFMRHAGLMTGMVAVLVLAGCILALTIVQMVHTGRQLQETVEDNARIRAQLGEIQEYLLMIDDAVTDTGEVDAETYEELSAALGTLQGNLTDYRSSNDIEDGEISGELDGIIDSLARLQENIDNGLESQEDASDADEEDDASMLSSIDSQLTALQEAIRLMTDRIEEDSSDGGERYASLLSLLNGTDADLEILADTVSEENASVQTSLQNGISGVKSLLSSLQDASESLSSGLSELETMETDTQQLVSDTGSFLSEQLTSVYSQLDSSVSSLETNLTETISAGNSGLQTSLTDVLREALTETGVSLKESLYDSLRAVITEQGAAIQAAVAAQEDTLLTGIESLSSEQSAMAEELDALQEDISALSAQLSNLEALIQAEAGTGTGTETDTGETGSEEDGDETEEDSGEGTNTDAEVDTTTDGEDAATDGESGDESEEENI